jgi:hypothetical protein
LVEELPDSELEAARRYLEYLRDIGDPLLRALLRAPEDDKELSDKTAAALKEARQEVLRERGRPWGDVRKELARE